MAATQGLSLHAFLRGNANNISNFELCFYQVSDVENQQSLVFEPTECEESEPLQCLFTPRSEKRVLFRNEVSYRNPSPLYFACPLISRVSVTSGSAKAHEKSGCQLCCSARFCEPHDYDYICPCDWHQLQSQKSTDGAELVVRQKALALPDFPDMKVCK